MVERRKVSHYSLWWRKPWRKPPWRRYYNWYHQLAYYHSRYLRSDCRLRKIITIMLTPFAVLNIASRNISTSTPMSQIIKLSRLRVVDNSEIGKQAMMEGRPPRCIHIYNKRGVGYIGDRILVAIRGEKKKGILVGLKQQQAPKVPKFDSNNLVLIDDNGTPLGTRIQVPIPHILRTKMKEKTHSKGADYTKLIAIASRFV